MAHDPESVHFALKRVDRSKRFILTAIVFLFIAILFTFGFLVAGPIAGSLMVCHEGSRPGRMSQAADREIDDFMTVPRSRPG